MARSDWVFVRDVDANAEAAVLQRIRAKMPHVLSAHLREHLTLTRGDAWDLLCRIASRRSLNLHELVRRRLGQIVDADLAAADGSRAKARKPTPAVRRELDNLGAATDADLLDIIVPGRAEPAVHRCHRSGDKSIAWTLKLGREDHALLAAAHARLASVARRCCGGQLRTVFGPYRRVVVTHDAETSRLTCRAGEGGGGDFWLTPDGTLDSCSYPRYSYPRELDERVVAAKALLEWARDPGRMRQACLDSGLCGGCGAHYQGPTGFGERCADLAPDLTRPLDPVPEPDDDAWDVLRAASPTLRDMPDSDDDAEKIPRCVVDRCRELVGDDDLDRCLWILARGAKVGWHGAFVPLDLVEPVATLADYLGVSCADLLDIVAADARFDLAPQIRAVLSDAFPL